MCGRFTLTTDAETIAQYFALSDVPSVSPRYNIAPTQPVLVIVRDEKTKTKFCRWGLIPSWAKDPKIGAKLINARAETVADKPAFRNAFRHRRCSIVADGFYEWQSLGQKSKQPYYFRLESQQPFAIAGLWENWISPESEEFSSCTILTTQANPSIASIHDRMPVILNSSDCKLWLNPQIESSELLEELLSSKESNKIEAYPVSSLVNNVRNDSAELLSPL
jgi:putative SOS response-associated peptidase YedK